VTQPDRHPNESATEEELLAEARTPGRGRSWCSGSSHSVGAKAVEYHVGTAGGRNGQR